LDPEPTVVSRPATDPTPAVVSTPIATPRPDTSRRKTVVVVLGFLLLGLMVIAFAYVRGGL
jgi:hypothetical protein